MRSEMPSSHVTPSRQVQSSESPTADVPTAPLPVMELPTDELPDPQKFAVEACRIPAAKEAPDDEAMVALLAGAKTIAVVGASPNPERTSNAIARWLMANTPYSVFLVNPVAGDADLMGHGFFPSLASLPLVPDIVDVFRRPDDVPPVARDAISVGAPALWMQLGITHAAAAAECESAGMTVVQNRCIKVEYQRLAAQIEAARA